MKYKEHHPGPLARVSGDGERERERERSLENQFISVARKRSPKVRKIERKRMKMHTSKKETKVKLFRRERERVKKLEKAKGLFGGEEVLLFL